MGGRRGGDHGNDPANNPGGGAGGQGPGQWIGQAIQSIGSIPGSVFSSLTGKITAGIVALIVMVGVFVYTATLEKLREEIANWLYPELQIRIGDKIDLRIQKSEELKTRFTAAETATTTAIQGVRTELVTLRSETIERMARIQNPVDTVFGIVATIPGDQEEWYTQIPTLKSAHREIGNFRQGQRTDLSVRLTIDSMNSGFWNCFYVEFPGIGLMSSPRQFKSDGVLHVITDEYFGSDHIELYAINRTRKSARSAEDAPRAETDRFDPPGARLMSTDGHRRRDACTGDFQVLFAAIIHKSVPLK